MAINGIPDEVKTVDKVANLVRLSRDYTRVSVYPRKRDLALLVASRRTLSPHEHTWTNDEAALMAEYCLWASQRLEAIEELARGKQLVHEEPEEG